MGGRGGSSGMSGGGGGAGTSARQPKQATIKGSEKQVQWAKDIRTKISDAFSDLNQPRYANRIKKVLVQEGYDVNIGARDIQSALTKALNKIDDAKWFINNRGIANPNYDYALAIEITKKTNLFKKKR